MADLALYSTQHKKNYDIFLENPLLFVLVGDHARKYYRILKQRFGNMGRCIFLQVIEDEFIAIEDEQVVKLRMSSDATGQYCLNCDNNFLKQLNEAVRQTKQYKYISGNHLAVCVLVNQKNAYKYIHTLCETLYNNLIYAYLSHIVFDVYCFLSEEFVFEASSGMNNLRSMQQHAKLAEREWIRYIFLVSDVNNEEIITTSEDSIFNLVLSSIALTNCNFGEKSISDQLRKDLSQEGQALGSKLLTIGGGSLFPKSESVKLLLRRELLYRIKQTCVSEEHLCKPTFEIASYYQEIFQDIQKECRYISRIYYYQPQNAPSTLHQQNSKLMLYYFKNAPEQFMQQVEETSEKRYLAKANDFFCTQIKPSLDDALRRSGVSVCDKGSERIIANAALQLLSEFQAKQGEALKSCKKEFAAWKNKIRRWRFFDKFFHSQDFIFTILEEWTVYREQEIAHSIFIKFLFEIQNCVVKWQNAMTEKFEIFSNAMQFSNQVRFMMQNETSKVDCLLLNFYSQSLKKFFNSNHDIVSSCRNDLGKLLVRNSNSADFDDVIQTWVDQVYLENFQNVSPYGESTIFGMLPSQQDQLFEEMYHALTQCALLQIRGSIPNIEPHICFVGGSDNKLIQYVQQQSSFKGFLSLSDECDVSLILYYQNIATFEDIPAYQLYLNKYGDDAV